VLKLVEVTARDLEMDDWMCLVALPLLARRFHVLAEPRILARVAAGGNDL
jgi:hypothetical protein